MLALTIDSPQADQACIKCCCDTVSLKPGETQPLLLNYAPWALPIAARGLHCEPSVAIEEKDTCDSTGTSTNVPPQIQEPVAFDVLVNTQFDGDLNTKVSDPEGDALTFKALPLYGPKHGKLVMHPSGMFDFYPESGYTGQDRFFASVSDGVNKPIIFEVLLGIGVLGSTVIPTPDLAVGVPTMNQQYYTVILPLIASPAARSCQVFRLSVRQGALDCDCNCYYHVDCVDVRIAQC